MSHTPKRYFNPNHYTDEHYTVDQILKLHEDFERVDSDRDGRIDRNQLIRLLSIAGVKLSKKQITVVLRDMTTAQKSLDFDDFLIVLKNNIVTTSDDIEDLDDLWVFPSANSLTPHIAFLNFDTNRSNFIEPEDIKMSLQSLGEDITDEDASNMVRMADLDGDGRVSFKDYSKFITNIKSSTPEEAL
ncbi:uncharacterized protein LOC142337327 isoform X1 [Convolutriloba macropyga]|uniref:uncharacterized protein LOC142337327 isoform X1 n=1 Tax=Convolutriloba macropyga TaxID=536237 RepID=UPI003F51E571